MFHFKFYPNAPKKFGLVLLQLVSILENFVFFITLILNYHLKTTCLQLGVSTEFHFGFLFVYKVLPLIGECSQLSTWLSLWIGHKFRDDFGGFKTLYFRTCHQHQLRECYSYSLFCMFLYFFSSYSNTTNFAAIKYDVLAYVVFNHVQFIMLSLQSSPVPARSTSYAVWEMGDGLEAVSDVEIQIENHLSSVRTKVTRRRGSCNVWWGKSFSVPMWIATSRASPWSFRTNVTGRKRFVQSLMREEFLGSYVGSYLRVPPWLFCTNITRRKGFVLILMKEEFLGSNVDF